MACFKVKDGGDLLRLWWVAVGDLLTPVRTGPPVRLKTTHNFLPFSEQPISKMLFGVRIESNVKKVEELG
ncbi:MAG: hypothetical protein EAZ32_18780 [Cytophagia bacterium]|nr:MAG: hypothetical protein EAZ38_01480 [Cytophagales bacterium]TAG35115.1 MAG: hypothetical protein EAZ32_18780 [Cytophagia bacterium]TAG51009.1 MAG: hypothetical protein EAZ29_11000 [Runella slithyformis]TAG69284.1 MAG: hypothetical protein EAZ26_07335 [Runella slithyformis]TAG77027.1 MAG: hypothetical protein EAZ22_16560 [Cytophagales bacterium]